MQQLQQQPLQRGRCPTAMLLSHLPLLPSAGAALAAAATALCFRLLLMIPAAVESEREGTCFSEAPFPRFH